MKRMKLTVDNSVFELRAFDRNTLEKSFVWLNDTDIQLGMNITYKVTKERQEQWFLGLAYRSDYKIWSFWCNNNEIGAGGFRNITEKSGELTCYIGDKNYWGTGKYLVDLLLLKAKELRFNEVLLKVLHTNVRAYNCYLKRGFNQIAEDSLFKTMSVKII